MSHPPEGAAPAESARYEFRVQGVLEPHWSAWFEGMRVTSGEHGQTTIAGPVVDQAALHGLLAKVATWACPSSRSADWTQTVNRRGGSDAAASQPKASAPDPRGTAAPDAQAPALAAIERTDRRRTPSGRLLAY